MIGWITCRSVFLSMLPVPMSHLTVKYYEDGKDNVSVSNHSDPVAARKTVKIEKSPWC